MNIYILGVGRNTIVYIDLVESCGYTVAGLYHYDNSKVGDSYFGHKIIGCTEDLLSSDLTDKLFAISVGDNQIRASLFKSIQQRRGGLPTIIHPSAIVSKYAKLGLGVIIHANSVIAPDVEIGDNSIISCNDLITHGSRVGKHCFVASNVVVGAYVIMNDLVFVGSGATIISGKVAQIGTNAFIGAGSVVTRDVAPSMCIAGNPARKI